MLTVALHVLRTSFQKTIDTSYQKGRVPNQNFWIFKTGLKHDSCYMKALCQLKIKSINFRELFLSGEFTWDDARNKCQERGNGWDLAIIDDVKGKKK